MRYLLKIIIHRIGWYFYILVFVRNGSCLGVSFTMLQHWKMLPTTSNVLISVSREHVFLKHTHSHPHKVFLWRFQTPVVLYVRCTSWQFKWQGNKKILMETQQPQWQSIRTFPADVTTIPNSSLSPPRQVRGGRSNMSQSIFIRFNK